MLHKLIELKPGWFIRVPYFFRQADMIHNRFDPATLALVAMGGGMALSAYSTLAGGKEAAEAGKFQQQQFGAEADAVLMEGRETSSLKLKEGERDIASDIAISSVSGGLVGSNAVRMAVKWRNYALDAETMRRNAGVQAKGLVQRGVLARYEGQLVRRNARMRAFADTASSAGQSYMLYKSYSSSAKEPTSTGYKGYIGPKKSPMYIAH